MRYGVFEAPSKHYRLPGGQIRTATLKVTSPDSNSSL
jgi:hypothetical protein